LRELYLDGCERVNDTALLKLTKPKNKEVIVPLVEFPSPNTSSEQITAIMPAKLKIRNFKDTLHTSSQKLLFNVDTPVFIKELCGNEDPIG